jgi:opacity protein-like surface antigen
MNRSSILLRLAFAFTSVPIAVALTSVSLAAQPRSTRGFEMGGFIQGTTLDPEDDLNDHGAGAGLFFGYGFNGGILLYLTAEGSSMEPEEGKRGSDYTLTQVDVGVRYRFRNDGGSRWRPFLDAAVTGLVATFEDVQFFENTPAQDVEISGPSFGVGGGMEYFLAPQWSLGLGVRWASGSFEDVKIGNVTIHLDEPDRFDTQTTRVQLGLRYHFSRD